jgi:hypothetical protein
VERHDANRNDHCNEDWQEPRCDRQRGVNRTGYVSAKRLRLRDTRQQPPNRSCKTVPHNGCDYYQSSCGQGPPFILDTTDDATIAEESGAIPTAAPITLNNVASPTLMTV